MASCGCWMCSNPSFRSVPAAVPSEAPPSRAGLDGGALPHARAGPIPDAPARGQADAPW